MTDIAQRMNERGIPVDRMAFNIALNQAAARVSPIRRDQERQRLHRAYASQLREVQSIDQHTSSWGLYPTWFAHAFYWGSRSPSLTAIPVEFLQTVTNSVQVDQYQPYPFLAALFAEQKEALAFYRDGGDLFSFYAEQLGLDRSSAKKVFYQAICGRTEPVVVNRMPWLIELRDSYNAKARANERVTNWFGTEVRAAQPQFLFWVFMQRTALDLCREGIIHAFRMRGDVPLMIHHNTVVGEPGIEDMLQRTWGTYFGLRTIVTRRDDFSPRRSPAVPAA